ncbi:MAG: flagellar assembly protein FliW [Zetaproteobacteria bacterium CG2_30_46_52]|nr:MAG: flagellar assembly protein FliW [Zetaproteobacteria bacterium CG2_30_46_52]
MQVVEKTQVTPEKDTVLAFDFPQGIAGFSGAKSFAFIYAGSGDLLCLQSIDMPEASFILTPWNESRLGATPKLSSEQQGLLQADADSEIIWFLVLNPFADKDWVTANLRAPIAICESQQTGLQCIASDTSLELRYRWMAQPKAAT